MARLCLLLSALAALVGCDNFSADTSWHSGSYRLIAVDTRGQMYLAVDEPQGSPTSVVGPLTGLRRFAPTLSAVRHRWNTQYLNYFRDHDPQTGRYIESAPIGLAGGSLTTYGYTGANPTSASDPSGLLSIGPAALEAALKRAGLAEIAGAGPEDPFADMAGAIANHWDDSAC